MKETAEPLIRYYGLNVRSAAFTCVARLMLNWGKYLRAALQKVAEKEAILENCDLRNGVNIFFGPMSVSELNNMTIIRPMFNRRSPRSGFVQWNLPETGIFSESSFNVEIRLLPQIVDFRFVPQTVPFATAPLSPLACAVCAMRRSL